MKFIANSPAMLIGKSLVIADMHLGIECELGMECKVRKLVRDSVQHAKQILKETKANRLIILGDVKHRIAETGSPDARIEKQGVSELEWKIEQEIPSILQEIREDRIDISIIKGNHDGRLRMETEDEIFLEEKDKRSKKIVKFCLIHGHKVPSQNAIKSDFLVMGHAHPAVSFKDKLGRRSVKKIWIKGRPTKALRNRYPDMNPDIQFIVMPAFNDYIIGSPINETELVGPLLKRQIFKISKAQLFLLNGIELDYKTLSAK